jgi:type II secretory pathway pseudopilin PulG
VIAAFHSPDRRVRRRGGFTIVELMAAVFVLVIVFGSAFPVLRRAAFEIDTAQNIAAAGAILQTEFEKERLFTWAQAADATYQPTVDAGFTRDPALAGRFTLVRTVTPMTGRETRMLQITLTAHWRGLDGVAVSRRFTTYYRNGGLNAYVVRTP